MYKDYLNKNVTVVVTTRSQGAYEVKGLLSNEDAYNITITDARIGLPVGESLKQNGLFNGLASLTVNVLSFQPTENSYPQLLVSPKFE